MRIASALTSGDSYTYEDARRTNTAEGWTYGQVKSMHLSDEELDLAWLTANRRVDNDADLL